MNSKLPNKQLKEFIKRLRKCFQRNEPNKFPKKWAAKIVK